MIIRKKKKKSSVEKVWKEFVGVFGLDVLSGRIWCFCFFVPGGFFSCLLEDLLFLGCCCFVVFLFVYMPLRSEKTSGIWGPVRDDIKIPGGPAMESARCSFVNLMAPKVLRNKEGTTLNGHGIYSNLFDPRFDSKRPYFARFKAQKERSKQF